MSPTMGCAGFHSASMTRTTTSVRASTRSCSPIAHTTFVLSPHVPTICSVDLPSPLDSSPHVPRYSPQHHLFAQHAPEYLTSPTPRPSHLLAATNLCAVPRSTPAPRPMLISPPRCAQCAISDRGRGQGRRGGWNGGEFARQRVCGAGHGAQALGRQAQGGRGRPARAPWAEPAACEVTFGGAWWGGDDGVWMADTAPLRPVSWCLGRPFPSSYTMLSTERTAIPPPTHHPYIHLLLLTL
ncbi:hypothetical protein B0H14DRAFT_367336 [Mycena olivaceomarginata]|nr:hypothetical protein B0H14DRAFT_367336 [Mycena olivaceomarginata]